MKNINTPYIFGYKGNRNNSTFVKRLNSNFQHSFTTLLLKDLSKQTNMEYSIL